MDCKNEQIHINKLPVGDNFIYILSDWSAEKIDIKILETSGFHKWCGAITEEIMHLSAKDLGLGFDDYKNECKLALTTNRGKEGFNYILEDGKFKLQKCKRFRTTYFEIELLESLEDFKFIFLDYSADVNENLFTLLSKKDEILNNFKTEIENLIAKYQKCKAEKDDLEITLFSKFALLLNSKKNRIKKLENILRNEGIPVKYNSKRKTNNEQSIINSDIEVDLFENNEDGDVFDAETQAIAPEETQTLNILNLPKRQKFVPSFEQRISGVDCEMVKPPEMDRIQTCRNETSTSSRISPVFVARENSSEEYFAKM